MDHFSHPISPMAGIVEQFLIARIYKDIEIASGMYKSNWNLFLVHDECTKIMKLILEKKPGTGAALRHVRKEKLYYLLNIMAEWLQLLEKKDFLTQVSLPCADDFRQRLKQIEKDLLQEQQLRGESQEEEAAAKIEFYRWSSHAVDITKIHGFEDKRMTMERRLLREGSKWIGIVGVAGVGKTALSQVAFNDPKVQKHFLLRIWLCLSKQQQKSLDVAEGFLVRRMLSCLGFEDEVIEEVGQAKLMMVALKQQLKRGKYLIVLDDIWKCKKEEGDDEKMGEAIEKLFSFLIQDPVSQYGSRHGGALIVTSRSGELEKTVRPNNLHQLKLLPLADKDSCWEIFKDQVIKEDIGEFEKHKAEILQNIQGLPLMAKMLGQSSHLNFQPKHPGTTIEN